MVVRLSLQAPRTGIDWSGSHGTSQVMGPIHPEEKEELKRDASLLQSGAEQVLSNIAEILSGPMEVLFFRALISLRTSESSHDREHSDSRQMGAGRQFEEGLGWMNRME